MNFSASKSSTDANLGKTSLPNAFLSPDTVSQFFDGSRQRNEVSLYKCLSVTSLVSRKLMSKRLVELSRELSLELVNLKHPTFMFSNSNVFRESLSPSPS